MRRTGSASTFTLPGCHQPLVQGQQLTLRGNGPGASAERGRDDLADLAQRRDRTGVGNDDLRVELVAHEKPAGMGGRRRHRRRPADRPAPAKWHSGFRTRREAESELAAILMRLDGGTYTEPTRQTVAAYLEQWLSAQQSRLRPSTHESIGASCMPT